jgi:uncharacterized protein (DUF305 family)
MTTFKHAQHRVARRRLAVVGALAAGALALTACGGNGSDSGSSDSGSSNSGNASQGREETASQQFNDADVMFAQMMIPHHQQAVQMSELVPGRASDQEIKTLAGKIEEAQDPEINTMKSWLKSWDKPASMPGMDHSSGMPGMMSDKDMAELKKAKSKDFDRMFADMMIDHHKGAITMAKDEQKSGRNALAKKLAGKIIKSQTAEISEMNKILDRL